MLTNVKSTVSLHFAPLFLKGECAMGEFVDIEGSLAMRLSKNLVMLPEIIMSVILDDPKVDLRYASAEIVMC